LQRVGSNRSFGLFVVLIFLGIGAIYYWIGGAFYWWGLLAAIFLAVSFAMPRVLAPLRRAWLKLGSLLHFIIGPVMLGLAYLLAIIPTGLVVRLCRKDLLSLRRDPAARSYWVRRDDGGLTRESLKDQF